MGQEARLCFPCPIGCAGSMCARRGPSRTEVKHLNHPPLTTSVASSEMSIRPSPDSSTCAKAFLHGQAISTLPGARVRARRGPGLGA
jgi:hypothetical protein